MNASNPLSFGKLNYTPSFESPITANARFIFFQSRGKALALIVEAISNNMLNLD
jgi:hypothetical protein